MKNPSSLPPIASPEGAGAVSPPFLDPSAAYIRIDFSWRSRCRRVFFEWLTPYNIVMQLVAPLWMALHLVSPVLLRHGISDFSLVYGYFFLLWFIGVGLFSLVIRLFPGRHFVVQISQVEISGCNPGRTFHFPWKYIVWIVEWRGDVWIASYLNGCFVPREAFGSRADAKKFVSVLRELKRSKGQSWRDEWDGHNFGLPHEEI